MTKRQEEALKTRQKLLDKATDYIVSGDFSDIKVEDITKACGCAKGTFYVYLKTKKPFVARFVATCLAALFYVWNK